MYKSATSVPRGFIIFAQIMGTTLMTIGLIAYCAMLDQVLDQISNRGAVAAIMALLVYFT